MTKPTPYHENRPWGNFIEFIRNSPTTVKIITVSPGQTLSLQFHKNRSEFWHIISGSGEVQIGDLKHEAKTGDEFFVEKEVNHRIFASHGEPFVILELALGEFDENDITRLEDVYGRK